VRTLDPARSDDETGNVLATKNAVYPAAHANEHLELVIGEASGARSKATDDIVELRPDGPYVAKRDRGGDERHDLPIFLVDESVHRANRVGVASIT
jgi:hypothetical protein